MKAGSLIEHSNFISCSSPGKDHPEGRVDGIDIRGRQRRADPQQSTSLAKVDPNLSGRKERD